MGESMQLFNIKMLILKRWNQAQTGYLFDESVGQRGQYISFQSYHFIDVYPIEGDSAMSQAYERLQNKKVAGIECENSSANGGRFNDTHMVQSITLLGEDGTFWEKPTEVMNITFIQQTDSTKWWYDAIKRQLSEKIDSKKTDSAWTQVEWALYYSLDFCDLVLFTKNLKLKHLNDLLWDMPLFQHENNTMIRDTFTITCFKYDFLRNFFKNEESNQNCDSSLGWDDEVALSINLSARDLSVLPGLLQGVSQSIESVKKNRLLGRYDFRITTEKLQGNQALKVLYQIDTLFKDKNKNGRSMRRLNGYEVVPLVEAPIEAEYPNEKVSAVLGVFENKAERIFDELYDLYIKENLPFIEYVTETIRSLRELNNSGFSEEFILSVLPSLVTFVEIAKQATSFYKSAATDFEREKIWESLLQMQKSYFNALNTLALCTMHSERQFIHAPAFNATYFEIPPKMLAFYNAITDHIASRLTEGENKKYYFIIAPDYRSDIYVRPLNVNYIDDTTRHLAIINLPEKYFYEPEKAILLLAHEVGHYEGERNREKRAELIFKMTGIILLQYTPIIKYEQTARLLAEEFGDFLYNQYIENQRCVRKIKAQLDDVARFLTEVHYGIDYFTTARYQQEMVLRWCKALYKGWDQDAIRQECSEMLKNLDKGLQTNYFAALTDKDAFMGACDAIARSIINKLSNLIQPSMRTEYQNIADTSETIIQAFSEAFADRQMLTVMGEKFDQAKDYGKIIKDIQIDILKDMRGNLQEESYTPTIEQKLRYNAIKRIEKNILEDDTFAIQDDFILCEAVEAIVSYLKSVEDNQIEETDSWRGRAWEKEFLEAQDWRERCEIICMVLSDYKKSLYTTSLEMQT